MVARISAKTSIDWSTVTASNTAGATVRTKPTQMAIPTRGSDSTVS